MNRARTFLLFAYSILANFCQQNADAQNCAPSGIVSWWAAENDASDITGANPGLLRNGVQFGLGKVGNAFILNGINQVVEIASQTNLIPTGSFSIEAWINPSQTGDQTIFSKWSDTLGRAYIFAISPANALIFAISDASRQDDAAFHTFVSTNNAVALNAWTHVAAVYDQPSGKRKIYANGVKIAERTDPSLSVYNANNQVAIGGRFTSPNVMANLFAGRIDEVSFYNRALTDAEISSIANAQGAGKCGSETRITTPPQDQTVPVGGTIVLSVSATGQAPLVYQWLFKGTALPGATNATLQITNAQSPHAGLYTVVVSSSSGSPITSSAMVTVGGSCFSPPPGLISWWPGNGDAQDRVTGNTGILKNGAQFVAGKAGQAFSFSGNNQHVELTNSPILNITGSLTIEAWVYPTVEASQAILGRWNDNVRSYTLNLMLGNSIRFAISDDAHQSDAAFHAFDTASNIVPLNAWSHIAGVYNQAAGLRQIFLNGVKVAEKNDGSINITTGTHNAGIGARIAFGSTPDNLFTGMLDEVSLYGRALTADEIFGIYNAGALAKCPTPVAPFVVSHPQPQSVQAGASATFRVGVAGTGPLTHQWFFNGASLPGQTNSTLTLTNVQANQAGPYRASATGPNGSATSSNAVLTVQLPPSVVRVINSVSTNSSVSVPIVLTANGAENSVSFSVSYNTSQMTFRSVTLGSAVLQAGGSLIALNTNQAASGRVGFAIALPGDKTLAVGSNQLMNVQFATAPANQAINSTLTLTDTPVARQVVAADARILQATFTGGSVQIPFVGYEGDVAPAAAGDNLLSTADWLRMGRIVVGLDSPTGAAQFQRADMAPRSSLGNGLITAGDWAQAARYAAGLDPLTAVGGPTSDLGPALPLLPETNSAPRAFQIVNVSAQGGKSVRVPIQLTAIGNENAAAFSLVFDPSVLTFTNVALAGPASSAFIVVNTNQASSGTVAIAISLPSGQVFPLGLQTIVTVDFLASPFTGGVKPVVFANRPTIAEVSDSVGVALATRFLNGAVTITSDPGTEPVAPLIQGTINDAGAFVAGTFSTDPTVVLKGAAQPGTIATVTLIGVGIVGQSTTDTNGNWVLDLARQLSEGTNIFNAVASTLSGQTSPSSENFALTIASARLVNVRRSAVGSTEITLEGTIGRTYTLQVSHDLNIWVDLETFIMTAPSRPLTDTTNANASASYYRLKVSR